MTLWNTERRLSRSFVCGSTLVQVPNMLSIKYDRLSQDDSSLEQRDITTPFVKPSPDRSLHVKLSAALLLSFAISLCANVIFIYQRYFQAQALYNDLPTQYAHLRRNLHKDIVPQSDFSSLNRTIQDAAWNSPRLNSWDLFVALDEDYVVSQGLPHSMRWPWDSRKGVYILTAAHELHCVDVIRSYMNGRLDGIADSDLEWGYGHSIHCLNVLRETIMCNADDLPMYTGHLHDNLHFDTPIAGRGMKRMCRNWDSLMEWAHERSACYLSTDRKNQTFQEIDRYRYCPDGSRPWEIGAKDERH